MLVLLTGSAASGKSSVLQLLVDRRSDVAAFDMDDLRPPAEADALWWRDQLEHVLQQALAAQQDGTCFLLAAWTGRDELLQVAGAADLGGLLAVLLDCSDAVRRERLQQRTDSGTWRAHTVEEVASYLRAAEDMRHQESASVNRIDTSELSLEEVADRVETLIGPRTTAFVSHGLCFREWRLADVETMVALFDTDQMNLWTPLASPFSLEAARAYVASALASRRATGLLQLAVLLEPETPPVGEILVFPSDVPDQVELAYAVGAQYQRQGVATGAVSAGLELARDRGARRAMLSIAEGNEASAGVARAAGFRATDAPLRERRRKGFVLQMRTWTRDLHPAADVDRQS